MGRRDSALHYFDKNQRFMETTVLENIERYRKGDARVTLTDGGGAPLSGASVTLKHKNL